MLNCSSIKKCRTWCIEQSVQQLHCIVAILSCFLNCLIVFSSTPFIGFCCCALILFACFFLFLLYTLWHRWAVCFVLGDVSFNLDSIKLYVQCQKCLFEKLFCYIDPKKGRKKRVYKAHAK